MLLAASTTFAVDAPVSFSRDILPILSDNCLSCHGPDESHRKAGLRLDLRDAAVADNKGTRAIVPGDPAASELIARLVSEDPDDVMPPPKSHKPKLSAAQIDLFRRWIKAGAEWGTHWAFERPVKAPPPGPAGAHPVDAFVRDALAKAGRSPAKPAAPHTLLRRASFDLTGLPPSPADVAAFEADPSPAAYRAQVKRMLASEAFGERMAMWWLDLARYADTDGFQQDESRTNWPWRDWVAASFNANKPFDQFTVEQFAGDLLPKATVDQKLATCFHRNHMTNGEGGRDAEESRVDYVIDRTNTVGTVWLGLTLGCAQCHTHKFDPVTQAEYYRFSAFFNSVDEDGKAGKGAKPFLQVESPHAKRAVAEAQALVDARKPAEAAARAAAEKPFEAWLAARAAEVRGGTFVAWRPLVGAVEAVEGTVLSQEPDGTIVASGLNPNQDDYRLTAPPGVGRVTGLRLEVLPHASHTGGGLSHGKSGEFLLTNFKVQARRRGASQGRELTLATAAADFSADKKANNNYGDVKDLLDDDPRSGWTTKGSPATQPHVAVLALAEPYVPAADEELVVELRQRSTLGDANIGRFRLSVSDQPGEAVRTVGPGPMEALAAAGDVAKIDAKLRGRLMGQFLEDHAAYQAPKAALARAERQLGDVKKAVGGVSVMVLAERPKPRETFVLVRGVWDAKGDKVEPGVPAAIGTPPSQPPRTREDLAKWLVSKDNPLTPRVVVNHVWQLLFGSGLVRTPDDFGLQGERPTHPQLLDWLAVDFVEHGWDVKRLVEQIVTSETYQQDSAATPELLAVDPDNRLLARGARYRLPAWMLRDAALANAGLLNPAVGGPPVKPFQPPGVWEEIFMGRFKYEPSEGPAQYRRTLYAFWRRSVAPTFLFDSAQRRVCEVRTSRTNTPLQALTLLNDETQLAAARALALQAVKVDGDARARLEWTFARALSRRPTDAEVAVLSRELERASAYYRAHPADADRFLANGQAAADVPGGPRVKDAPAVAAYAVVAGLVLNLDEAITHE